MNIKTCIGFLFAGFVPIHAFAATPNIVFILTDDQGYGDLGCYGATTFETPNIDRLCAEGMKFESFYVHNRCSPTRAALMTGTQAERIGAGKVIYRREKTGLHPDEVTLPELLRGAGYSTGMVGKWHLGEWDEFHPLNHGFDRFFGFWYHSDAGKGIYRDRTLIEKIKSQTDGVHSPKLLSAAIDFMRSNKDKPFFLYYASPLPHTKWIPNERFAGTSQHGVYGDVVQEIDWQVGEILKTLDQIGVQDNTLVIYTSDNGPQLNVDGHGSSQPLRGGKWTNFEGGIRVPCIMRWPGKVPAGSINNDITTVFDVLPTLCEITDVDPPADRVLDGRSILSYMLGKETRAPIHDTFLVPGSTVRRGDWKLFVKSQKPGGKAKPGEGLQGRTPAVAGSLFDLKNDPGETTDVSEQYPAKVKELATVMVAFEEELRATKRPIGKTQDWTPADRKSKK